jgi:hypothetical protein
MIKVGGHAIGRGDGADGVENANAMSRYERDSTSERDSMMRL